MPSKKRTLARAPAARRQRSGADVKITVENVNVPGYTTRLDAAMYGAMRRAILTVLPAESARVDADADTNGRRPPPAKGSLPGRRQGRLVGQGGAARPGSEEDSHARNRRSRCAGTDPDADRKRHPAVSIRLSGLRRNLP